MDTIQFVRFLVNIQNKMKSSLSMIFFPTISIYNTSCKKSNIVIKQEKER